jgi:hypothetical protein
MMVGLFRAMMKYDHYELCAHPAWCLQGGAMTEATTTPQGVPVITADPFSLESLADPHALHEQLREAGPVVYLDRYGI